VNSYIKSQRKSKRKSNGARNHGNDHNDDDEVDLNVNDLKNFTDSKSYHQFFKQNGLLDSDKLTLLMLKQQQQQQIDAGLIGKFRRKKIFKKIFPQNDGKQNFRFKKHCPARTCRTLADQEIPPSYRNRNIAKNFFKYFLFDI
jgi:hypothetical protein